MSLPESSLPPALREAIGRDFGAVRPLRSPWVRSAVVALPVFAAVATVAVVTHSSLSLGGPGFSAFEWAVALGLTALALREAVPGRSVGAQRVAAALAFGAIGYLALVALLWRSAGAGWSGPQAVLEALGCGSVVGRLSALPLAIAIWLVLRAVPVRPGRSGALAGAAAGLYADSIWHLICHRSDLVHLSLGHGGAVVVMTAVGALAGYLLRRGRQQGV